MIFEIIYYSHESQHSMKALAHVEELEKTLVGITDLGLEIVSTRRVTLADVIDAEAK